MQCPKCNQPSTVVDTIKRRTCIDRKRRCTICQHRFTTTEHYNDDTRTQQLRDVVRAIDDIAGAVELMIKGERGKE